MSTSLLYHAFGIRGYRYTRTAAVPQLRGQPLIPGGPGVEVAAGSFDSGVWAASEGAFGLRLGPRSASTEAWERRSVIGRHRSLLG